MPTEKQILSDWIEKWGPTVYWFEVIHPQNKDTNK